MKPIATLTVVAALLPMMFVSGLMGPYMAPIPANASAAMLFSFFVAVVLAPWLMLKLVPKQPAVSVILSGPVGHPHEEGRFGAFYRRIARPIIAEDRQALPVRRWVRHLARLRLVCNAHGAGKAPAVRQQIRTAGRHRSA